MTNEEAPVDPSAAEAPAPWHNALDLTALRALAHPLRVEIMNELSDFGPATASMLAERLGESSGATSYHLRQLAKHDIIVEDTERGSGRERWWRMAPGGVTIGSPETLGKQQGSDERLGKRTYVTEFGVEGARALAARSHARARDKLAQATPDTGAELEQITDFIATRSF